MDSFPFPVHLFVYDLSRGAARLLSPGLIGRQIDGIWHTSVIVYGEEWYFGQGIYCTTPGVHHYGAPVQKIEMGATELPRDLFLEFLNEIRLEFRAERYHLLEHNCNHFSDRLCQFLVGKSIPSFILNLPQDFLQTPFGQSLRPLIDSMFSAGQSNVPMFVEPTPPILNTSFSTPNPTFPALTREAQTPYQTTTLHPNFWNTYNSLLSKKSNSSVVPTETLKVWIDDPLRFHSNLLKLILDNLSVSFEYNWLFLELANQMLEFTYDSKSDFHQAFVQNLLNLNVLSLDSIDYLQALLKVFIRLVARHVSLIMLYPSISQVLEVTLMHSDPSLSTLSLQLCFNLSRYFFLNHQKSNVLDTKDDKEDEEFIISWFSGLLQLLLPMLLPEDIIESTFSTLFYSICFCLSLGYPSFKDLLFTFLPKHDLTSKKSWLKSHRIPEDVVNEFFLLLSDE